MDTYFDSDFKQISRKCIPKAIIEDISFKIDQVYIIDGTERQIQRDTSDQETFYSGKKKTHTLKMLYLFLLWV